MSANVGLSTPRGSGTSGYVQKNHAHLRPRDQIQFSREPDLLQHRQRQPDKQILEHERAREIEVKVFDLRDQLEEDDVDDDEIEAQCDAFRQRLTKESARSGPSGKSLKKYQVHEMAAAKIQESDRLRRALGISKDYEEGGHWKKQEERLRESVTQRGDDAEPNELRHREYPQRGTNDVEEAGRMIREHRSREDDQQPEDRRRQERRRRDYDEDANDRRTQDKPKRDFDDESERGIGNRRRRESNEYENDRRDRQRRRSSSPRYRLRSRSPR